MERTLVEQRVRFDADKFLESFRLPAWSISQGRFGRSPLKIAMNEDTDLVPTARQVAATVDLQEFCVLKRWRRIEDAHDFFHTRLSANIAWFPVRAEYVDLLLLSGRYDEAIKACDQYIEDSTVAEELAVLTLSRSVAVCKCSLALTVNAIIEESYIWEVIVGDLATHARMRPSETGREETGDFKGIRLDAVVLALRLANIHVQMRTRSSVSEDSEEHVDSEDAPDSTMKALRVQIRDPQSKARQFVKDLFKKLTQAARYWDAYRIFQGLSSFLSIAERDECVWMLFSQVNNAEASGEATVAFLSMVHVYVHRLYEGFSSYDWTWDTKLDPLRQLLGTPDRSACIVNNLTASLRSSVMRTNGSDDSLYGSLDDIWMKQVQLGFNVFEECNEYDLSEAYLVSREAESNSFVSEYSEKLLPIDLEEDADLGKLDFESHRRRRAILRSSRDPAEKLVSRWCDCRISDIGPFFGNNENHHTCQWLVAAALRGSSSLVKMGLTFQPAIGQQLDLETMQIMFVAAASKGHLNIVEMLLAKDDTLLQFRDSMERSAFSHVAQAGHVPVMERMLGIAATHASNLGLVNQGDKHHRTPLHHACDAGNTDAVAFLVSREGVQLNAKDDTGQTPIALAAAKGNSAVVKCLVQCEDILPELCDEKGTSALAEAAKRNHRECVELLSFCRDMSIRAALHPKQSIAVHVIGAGTWTTSELLLSLLVLQDYSTDEKLWLMYQAARNLRKSVVLALFAANPSFLQIPDQHGRTIIGAAALTQDWEILEPLIKRDSVAIDFAGIREANLLHSAAIAGKGSVIAVLLRGDSTLLNTTSVLERTPLIEAAAAQQWELVEMLLKQANIDVNHKDTQGKNALAYLLDNWDAFRLDWTYAALAFVELKAVDVNLASDKGWTLLSLAVATKNTRLIERLVTRSDVLGDRKNAHGRTKLSLAAEAGNSVVVALLLRRWAYTVSWTDNEGLMAVDYARKMGHTSVETLLDSAMQQQD